MALFLPVVVTLVLLYILSFVPKFLFHRKLNRYAAKLPGPPLRPVLGNTYMFENKKNDEILQLFKEEAYRARERGDSIIRYMLPGNMIVWPLNGKALAEILESTTEIHKGSDYEMFRLWLGDGLLLSVGNRWKGHRKMLTPSFHFAKLEGFLEVFNAESKIFIDCLEKFAESGETVNVHPFINRCLLDIICEAAMGTKVNAQSNHVHPYLRAVKGYTDLMTEYSINPLLWNNFLYWALGYKKRQDEYLHTLKKFTLDVIAERKGARASGEVNLNESKRKMNFLDMLLSMTESNELTEEDLRSEVDTFMFGGHDTTTTSASWMVWNLAHDQDVQQKVYEELVEVCGEDPREDITYQQVNRLSYLDRVMRESKRVCPPVPVVSRCLQKEMVIDGHIIPPGANVCIAPVALHSNHLVYKNPEVFDPDRFLPENCSSRHSYDYIPFSAGIKNCIGQKFAILNEKVMISHLVRNFKIEPTLAYEGTRMCFEVVATPSNGIPVKLIRRA